MKFSSEIEKFKRAIHQTPILETLTSLNKEVRPFFQATTAFGVFPLSLPLAITAFGGPEGYFKNSLAIIAFWSIWAHGPKYYCRLGNTEGKESRLLNLRRLRLRTSPPITEVSRALRARNAENVSKMSPGASGPGTPKSLQKVSGTVRKVSGECQKSLFGLFPRLFGDFSGFRGRRPRETFSRLFRHFGPEGPERPL